MEMIKLNNNLECPVVGIGTFMGEIAKLDKGVRYYNRTDAQLAGFAAWRPSFEK